MIVSNALPIQFWPVDEDTYNETEACALTDRCFCQPIQCDDVVRIQATPEGDENIELFSPAVLDEDGLIVYDPHGFGSSGNHFFTPEDQGICDGKYQIIIYNSASEDLQTWEEPDEGWFDLVNAWTYTDSYAQRDGSGSASTAQDLNVPLGTNIRLRLQVLLTDAAGGIGTLNGDYTIYVAIDDNTGGVIDFYENSGTTAGGDSLTDNIDKVFVIPADHPNPVDRIRVGVTFIPSIAFTPRARVSPIDVGDILYIPTSAQVYKSDCLDIRTAWDCTKLISYSNYSDAFGLNYENQSPAPTFQLRVPCVFFHDTYPMEQEVHVLSNDTRVRLWNEMAHKRMLQLNFMPYYMHQKINMILMHDNIQIDGLYWDKEDAYEIVEGNWRFPLKTATVLLTERDFNKRNLI